MSGLRDLMERLPWTVIVAIAGVFVLQLWQSRKELRARIEARFDKKIRRDVSRLGPAPGGGSEDAVEEIVDISGGPLRRGGRRLALRDRRLLPKPPSIRKKPRSKRPKWFTGEEAARLFSPTMLTRDRKLRDLLPDEEQLKRLGLPIWRTEAEAAEALGLSLGEFRFFSIHRARETAPHYVAFTIPKRSGGSRLILAPKRRLKAIQRRLNDLLVSKLPVHPAAHGFRKGRSIRTGAEPHAGRAILLHMDIKDFFPSIHFGRVRGYLIGVGYGFPVASALAAIMTECERQPVEVDGKIFHVPAGSRHCVQGAPTSPGLANAIVRRLDARLNGVARNAGAGFAYTRYADDLTFSFESPLPKVAVGQLVAFVKMVVVNEGFALNREKTRVMRAGNRQTVTGVTVNQDVGLSRKERRKIRAMIHHEKCDAAKGAGDPARAARIAGKLAYLHMLNPAQAAKLRAGVGS